MCALLVAASASGQFNILHNFTGGSSDGKFPLSGLIFSDSKLYGVTGYGGSSNNGTAFSIEVDGTGFTLLHSFAGGTSDGINPDATLSLSGSTLYGVTQYGGNAGYGTLFSMNTNGTGFSLVHSFAGGISDGSIPGGQLALSGSTLYGMTSEGGSSNKGTLFSINTNGTGLTLLHTFTGGSDGSHPYGSLTLAGSKLYGMAWDGGSANDGTAFSLNTDGTGFTVIHTFTGGISDGSHPNGGLTLSDSKLYGMTMNGGSSLNDRGTVFSMNTDGTGFTLLHNFTEIGNDGSTPVRNLTLSDSKLYGQTYAGGTDDSGILFQINTDGTGYRILHTFTGSTSDGRGPSGDLTLSGLVLYGMTKYGGNTDKGVIFSYELAPEPSSFVLSALGLGGLAAGRRRRSVGGV